MQTSLPIFHSKHPKQRAIPICSGLFCLLLSANVSAADTSSDDASSKQLFAEGRKLAADGDFEKACPKFEAALGLHVGVGIQYNLADCWEHIGRTASAHALFLGVAASARASGQAEREQMAHDRALALEPRLSFLVIDVQAKEAELSVRKNHELVTRSDYGNKSPVDPGKYRIEATAPERRPWSTELDVRPGQTTTVAVPALEPVAGSCESPRDAAESGHAPKGADKRARPVVRVDSGAQRQRAQPLLYPLSLAALGVGGVAVGTVFAFKYHANNVAASETCPSSVDCTRAEIDHHQHLVDDAKMFRSWSFVSFGVGGAALLGAAALYLGSAPSSAPQSARSWLVAPAFDAASLGVSASGKF